MTPSRSIAQLLGFLVVCSCAISSADESESGLPTAVASVEIEMPIEDLNESCAEWAQIGECDKNPAFMLENCAVSCDSPRQRTAFIADGEDFAVGAIRFSEDFGVQDIPFLLQVAKKLLDASSDYTPPGELTHCIAPGKPTKPCTAGKLWKRAEDLRKAEIHDEAAADLVRALLKSGIEIDFVENAQRSLSWALQSIQRQRERERKEAEEEAKMEARKQEEMLAMEEAAYRKKEYEHAFGDFFKRVATSASNESNSAASADMEADGTVTTEVNEEGLVQKVKEFFMGSTDILESCESALQLIKKIPLGEKSVDVLLIESRCYELQGKHKSAMSSAGKLINKASSYGSLPNDSPIILAMQLGANSAMQLGLADSALSFYQTVLKFDPEQDRARTQYRGLKKVIKLMDKAEKEIQKGYNRAASEIVEECISKMRGLDVDSPLFRSKIQLKQCTILSSMGKHEEALNNCDAAVELRIGNDDVSFASRKEAHLVRAEALLLDDDYDEAVQDFRAAFDLVPDDDEMEKRTLHQKLQAAMRQQELWNGGKMDFRFNEKTGYPGGMPPQRDHTKILQLPIDLEERSQDIKCAWLRKQFKMLVKKFHPDKYKGNKKRAARKFKEIKEAKEILSKSWSC